MTGETPETDAGADHGRDWLSEFGSEFGGDFGGGSLAERMKIELLEAAPHRLVARMPVEGNTQPYGLLHGGASAVLAETLGSIGAQLHAGLDHAALGIELSCTHHRAAASGFVTGVATPIHLGRTVATYEIVITDDQDRRICTARLTCLLRPHSGSPRGGPSA